MTPELVTRAEDLAKVADRLRAHDTFALDLESNGLFKYRATLCTLQIAIPDRVYVVDTLATPVTPLADVLGEKGPRKIVHDVAFDARILAESGVRLGNVTDTSLVARMLGKMSTGLATLLAELGITLDKKLQHHDWTERPIRGEQLRYLAEDVIHLFGLATQLSKDLRDDVAEAVEEETRYRLGQAAAAAGSTDPRPAYLRLKGIDRVPKEQLPILRRLAEVREAQAKKLDVPAYKVLGPDILFAVAKACPRTVDALGQIKGATSGHRARALAPAIVEAVAAGIADREIPEEDQKLLERPRIAPSVVKARRQREARLTAWRKQEAKARVVDEQVVLPGHCLQDLADLGDVASVETIAAIPGIGRFRAERYGEVLRKLLSEAP